METGQAYSLFLLPVVLGGTIINWSIVFVILRITSMRNSFGYLTANQAIGDAIHSTTFLLYVCPLLYTKNETMSFYSKHASFLYILGYELSIHTHFVMSLNRVCAAFFPYSYSRVFSIYHTKVIIVFIWISTTIMMYIFHEVLCFMTYNPAENSFRFDNSKFCGDLTWYGAFIKNVLLVFTIAVFDTCTLVKIHQMKKKTGQTLNQEARVERSKKEMDFIKQAVIQGIIFAIDLLSFFLSPRFSQNHWILFFGTCFNWCAVHLGDGLVVLLLNSELRNRLLLNDNEIRPVPHPSVVSASYSRMYKI